LQKKGQLGIRHEDRQEEKSNGADGSRSLKIYRKECDDIIKVARSLSTYGFYFSSSSMRNHCHHCQHHRRSEYFLEEFKKSRPPTFDVEIKQSEDVEA
jgi:hypothetical protein